MLGNKRQRAQVGVSILCGNKMTQLYADGFKQIVNILFVKEKSC